MKLISSEERYRTPIFWITEDRAVDPSGFEIRRDIVRHRGSAVMMAVDPKGRILLVEQYRLPARAKMWEIPAGRLDEGETPLKAAKRELREETGLTAKKWTKLLEFYPSPGYVSEKMHIFVAREVTQGEAQPMEDERIVTRWFAPKELEAMLRDGKIQDGKTIAAFLAWQRWQREL
jgi:ADP-ribose pyrophosphatase